ncbi:hypothetical protein ACLKA7_009738 [Drosophila subpalustris]
MDHTQSKSKAASTMRGLVEDAKKTKLTQANNNNNSVASGRVKPMATMTSASTSRQLKGVIKTPTTTSSVGAKKTPQSMQQQVGKSTKLAASSTAAAATTTATTTANSASAKPVTSKAQAQKGQNQPQQAQPTSTATQLTPTAAPAPAPPLQSQSSQSQSQQLQPYNNNSNTIALPKASHANTNEELANGVQDTIYLCNFRVSVDGEWLCLKELQDIDVAGGVKTVGGGAAALNVSSAAGGSGAGTTSGGFVQQRHQTNHQFGQRNKRFSGLSTASGGNTFEDNGIMAIENLIGRRLCDVVGSNALAAPHQQHKNVGLIGGTLAEWSHLCSV